MKLVIRNSRGAESTSDNDTEESLSARAAARKAKDPEGLFNTLDTLVPVQLPPNELKAFLKAFHPRNNEKPQAAVFDELKYLIDVNAYLTAIFSGLQYGMYMNKQLVAHPPIGGERVTTIVGDSISKEIDTIYASAKDLPAKARVFMTTMSNGRNHIIQDSTKFQGGKDVVYLGLRGSTVSPLLSAYNQGTLFTLPVTDDASPEDEKQNYASEVGKALIATGFAIQKLLFGDAAAQPASAYKRINQFHPIVISWNIIAEITKLFVTGPLAKLGIPVMLPVLKAENTGHAVERMKDHFSVVALREPSNVVVLRRFKADKETQDEALGISNAALALQPDIRFSLAAHIPKLWCEYITQTRDAAIPLTSLNTWAMTWGKAQFRAPNTRLAKEDKALQVKAQRAIKLCDMPHYVFKPSVSDVLIERRKKLELYTEKGRSNEDGLVIQANGDLSYVPDATVTATKNAKVYEALVEEALEISFAAGTPLASSDMSSAGPVYDLVSPDYAKRIVAVKARLAKYKGSVQAINWDLNAVVLVSRDAPDHLINSKLVGFATPKDLNLASYLRSPVGEGMRNMFSQSKTREIIDGKPANVQIQKSTFTDFVGGVECSHIFTHFARAYNHFVAQGTVPKFADLVAKSAKILKITALDDDAVADYELLPLDRNVTIYGPTIARDMTFDVEEGKDGNAILRCLHAVLTHATGLQNTTLARCAIRDGMLPIEHERYFGDTSTIGDFSNIYAWLGGQLFYQACLAILAVPKDKILELNPDNVVEGQTPAFQTMMTEVMPLCIMLGKYSAPAVRDSIYKKADELKENESKFTSADLNIAGSKPQILGPKGEIIQKGMELFPHQEEALIRLKAHPAIAILDISPGGGKTTIALSDIAMLYADGLIKKPFVFCPTRLVKNWVDDLAKSFNGWNVIPITTESYKLWGDERLTEMIKSAPPNTIVVVGNDFLSKGKKTQIVIGNAVDKMSNSVEFCKKFQPDYLMLDESHRVRNTNGSLHAAIKTINMMTSVKFGRIGTGTLIQNVMSDVVGQTAIFNGQAFRTIAEFDKENKILAPGANKADYAGDTPEKARTRLADFATVISFKKKEWAFLLPSPIETFYPVSMGTMIGPDGNEIVDEMGHRLQLFYDAVLKRTLEAAETDPVIAAAEAKRKKAAAKKGKGKTVVINDDDEEDDDEEDDDENNVITETNTTLVGGGTVDSTDKELDDEDTDKFDQHLKTYLQRIERILTDPFGDPELADMVETFFGADVDTDWVTPKVQKVIERVKVHFTPVPWVKGKLQHPNDLCDYNGKTYIFKSEFSVNDSEQAAVTNFPPDKEDKVWKEQSRGKIFITCRYNRSVSAIYRALPPDMQAKTVKFFGEMAQKAKDESIYRFQNDDKCQILIANEQGVTEGHNFQMASRYIRVEAPWAPGELDQTSARIFRPDVAGSFVRQVIYLDWILCDQTLEVAKMGRLISKMLKRTAFDELNNPKYYKGLNPDNLSIISMSINNIKRLNKLSDLCVQKETKEWGPLDENEQVTIHPNSYLGQYQFLVAETGDEFREMRKTKRSAMVPVEPTKMPEGSKKIPFVPWVNNPPVDDSSDDGLIPLRTVLAGDNDLAAAVKLDRKALVGQYVRCEFGLGTIISVTSMSGRTSKKSEDEEDDTDDDTEGDGREVSKVRIHLAQGGEVKNLSPSKVFLATNVTARNKNKYNNNAPTVSAADKRRAERADARAEKALAKIREKDAAAKAKAKAERIAAKNRPVVVPAPKSVPKTAVPAGVDLSIELDAEIYNQFLALKAYSDPSAEKSLKRFGFEKLNAGAQIKIVNYNSFTTLLAFLEKRFMLTPKTVKQLDSLHNSFASGKGRKFQVELAPYSEFIQFHRMQSKPTLPSKDPKKPSLAIFPILVKGELYLSVDLVNNIAFKKKNLVGKAIEGVSGPGFKAFHPFMIKFVRNVTELRHTVRDMRKTGGFDVVNIDELDADVAKLNVRAALTNK